MHASDEGAWGAAKQTINVRTWSKTVPSYGLRLAELDLYVLKNHDDIVRALGHERMEDAASRRRNVLGWVLYLVAVLALVGGVSTLGGPILSTFGGRTMVTGEADALDDDIGIPFTSWCFVVVLLGVAVIAFRWWRTQRHWATGEVGYLAATVVCGVLALWQLASVREVDALGFAPESIPVWASVVVAAVLLVAMRVASRGRRVPVPRNFRLVGTPDWERAVELVGALEPRQRDKLLDERRRAIARLRERELIDAAEADRVGALPLGTSTTIAAP
ncbi:hypothetical protein [Prauserella flavalba]|uniref:Uncharacterized protein n=1 Tax=Prauserella flavalba TaxID=1477506 RepID=A0A318LNU4_9PSEU|nr:hypothetical protein [Prauserella flavalba]PXY34095.1 hypothetical protein BA062_18060 [Prauserella flavalba]